MRDLLPFLAHARAQLINGLVMVGAAKLVTDMVIFHLLPDGVSEVMRNKRAELVNKTRAFAQIGMKAATLHNLFTALDPDGNGYLEVKDLVAAYARIPGVSKKQALEVAATVLKVADKEVDDRQGTGKISFNEFMTLLEGSSALDFQAFVSLVHTTGDARSLDPKVISKANRAYDEAAGATGSQRRPSLEQRSSQAIFRSIYSDNRGRELVCSSCSEVMQVPKGVSRLQCPHCNEPMVAPRQRSFAGLRNSSSSRRRFTTGKRLDAAMDEPSPQRASQTRGGKATDEEESGQLSGDSAGERAEEEEEEAIQLGSLRAKYIAQKEGGMLPDDGPAARRERQGTDLQLKEEVQRRLSQHLRKRLSGDGNEPTRLSRVLSPPNESFVERSRAKAHRVHSGMVNGDLSQQEMRNEATPGLFTDRDDTPSKRAGKTNEDPSELLPRPKQQLRSVESFPRTPKELQKAKVTAGSISPDRSRLPATLHDFEEQQGMRT